MSAAVLPAAHAGHARPTTSWSAGARPAAATPITGAPAPAVRTRLRLTRRGRVVLTALAAVPVAVAALLLVIVPGNAAADVPGAGAGSGAQFEYITIAPGDSLWAIAETIAPQADPRVVVDEIVRLNALGDALVEAGEIIALPLGY